jgi:hypothetical protein
MPKTDYVHAPDAETIGKKLPAGSIDCTPTAVESANMIAYFERRAIEFARSRRDREQLKEVIAAIVECAIHVGSSENAGELKTRVMQSIR